MSVYGEGIYFSSEFGVSLPYSPSGYGWGGSILGAEIACVALCELINHPDVRRGDLGEYRYEFIITRTYSHSRIIT